MAKQTYHKMWEAVASVFYIDPGSVLPITESLPKVASYADKYWFFYAKNGGNGGAYYEEGEMEKAKIAGLKDFLNDAYREKYFRKVAEILEVGRSPLTRIENADLHTISTDELKELIIDSTQYLVDIFGYYLACQPQCVAGIEEKIQSELLTSVPTEKVVEIFTLLSTPTKTTTLRQEELDWLELLIRVKQESKDINDKEVQEALKIHQQKYHLLHLGDGAKILTLEFFVSKFEEDEHLSLQELQTKFGGLKAMPEKIESEKQQVIKEYEIPDDIIKMEQILAEIGHWRLEMRIQGWAPVQYFHTQLVKEAGNRLGIPNDKIIFATYEEVIGFLEGKSWDMNLLDARNNSYLFAVENGVAKIYSGHDAEKKFNQLVEKVNLEDVREIKGNTAMKGKRTGTAVVFRWGDDMTAKMKLIGDNTILVAGQTRPELMPLIAKSKAIVTDEGGITSHAAIVSRELGIPCVIGTKIATLLIKDGDLIEVDADQGMVRILDKSDQEGSLTVEPDSL